jgi:hypothetical protein
MSVRFAVISCAVFACAPQAQPRQAAPVPVFVQYERVGMKLLVGGAPMRGATAELSLDGPEPIGVVVPLGEAPGNVVDADLGRLHRPGDYRVRVATPSGVTVRVVPDHFRVVAEPAVPLSGISHPIAQQEPIVARSGLGTFIVGAEGRGLVIESRGGTASIDDGHDATAAASEYALAIAYATAANKPRLALLDGVAKLRWTIDLGTDDGATFRLIERDREWVVAWTSNDLLSNAEIEALRRDGEMVPIDRRAPHVWIAVVDETGRPRSKRRVGDGHLLALARRPGGYALLVSEPTLERPCGATAGQLAHLRLLDDALRDRGSDTHVFEPCLTPGAALAAAGANMVAALATCHGDARRLVLLDVDAAGHFDTRARSLDHIDPGIELRAVGDTLWLVFAALDDRTTRRQTMIAPLADRDHVDAIAISDGHDEVGAIHLVGDARNLAVLVRTAGRGTLVELGSIGAPAHTSRRPLGHDECPKNETGRSNRPASRP